MERRHFIAGAALGLAGSTATIEAGKQLGIEELVEAICLEVEAVMPKPKSDYQVTIASISGRRVVEVSARAGCIQFLDLGTMLWT